MVMIVIYLNSVDYSVVPEDWKVANALTLDFLTMAQEGVIHSAESVPAPSKAIRSVPFPLTLFPYSLAIFRHMSINSPLIFGAIYLHWDVIHSSKSTHCREEGENHSVLYKTHRSREEHANSILCT